MLLAAHHPSVPYPHHHHGDIVGRAPLHRLVGQPVAGCFVAGVDCGLPFPGLDLLILPDEKGNEWMGWPCTLSLSWDTTARKRSCSGLHQGWQDKLTSESVGSVHTGKRAKELFNNGRTWGLRTYTSLKTKTQLGQPLLPCEISHLETGQDEVHGFFWGKDLEEPITGQQNEPTTPGRNINGF